jgi:hypothetical protein
MSTRLFISSRKSTALRAAVDECDVSTGENFKKLIAILQPPERTPLARFRSKATFHYDKHVSAEHLQAVTARDPAAPWSFSKGSTPLGWYFELGDVVMDRMVVRFVLGANEPPKPALSKEREEIGASLNQIAFRFTNFATSFIERHCR